MRVVTSAETAGSSNRSGGALAMMKVAPLSSLFDPPRLDHQQIADLLERLADLAQTVTDADPDDKAELYKELGLKMTYYPQKQYVEAQVIPDPHMCKWFVSEGDLNHSPTICPAIVIPLGHVPLDAAALVDGPEG